MKENTLVSEFDFQVSSFFEKNKMEARIFFDAVLQPPEALSAQIAELKKEFDELNRKLYREILDSRHYIVQLKFT